MRNLLIYLFFFQSFISFSQPYLAWEDIQTEFGSYLRGLNIRIDSENRIYYSNQGGSFIRKTKDGDTVWVKSTNSFPYLKDFIIDKNDDLVLISYSTSSGGEWVITKIDSLGNTLWTTNVNGPSGTFDKPNAIDLDQNNNIYVTGQESNYSSGTFYTAKIKSNGILDWATSYRGPYLPKVHEGTDISVYDENNIYAIGFEYTSSSLTDTRLIKYNVTGDTVWTRKFNWYDLYGGSYQSDDRGLFVDVDALGDIYIVSNKTPPGVSFLKYDSNGNFLWTDELNLHPYNQAFDFIVDSLGNSYTIGTYNSNPTDTLYVIKRNSSGTIEWTYKYLGSRSCYPTALELTNSFIYVSAYQSSCSGCSKYHLVLKIDLNGNLIWDYFEDSNEGTNYGGSFDIAIDSFGGVYLTGGERGVSTSAFIYHYKLYDCDYNSNVTIELDSNNNLFTNLIAESYQWIKCDANNTEIQGQNQPEMQVTENGIYALVTTIGDCSDTSNCIQINSLNIDEMQSISKNIPYKIFDILGRETEEKNNIILIYLYTDGTRKKVYNFKAE